MSERIYAPNPQRPDRVVKVGEVSEEQRASYSPIEALARLAYKGQIQSVADDIERLCAEVDRFAAAMKVQLVDRALQGKQGWDRTDDPIWTETAMVVRAARAARRGDYVAAANYVMFADHWVRAQEMRRLMLVMRRGMPD